MQPEETTRGVIVLVQEARFELEDTSGRRRLFVLDQGAPLEPGDLQELQAAGIPVRVVWSEAEGLIAAVAHDVVPLDED